MSGLSYRSANIPLRPYRPPQNNNFQPVARNQNFLIEELHAEQTQPYDDTGAATGLYENYYTPDTDAQGHEENFETTFPSTSFVTHHDPENAALLSDNSSSETNQDFPQDSINQDMTYN